MRRFWLGMGMDIDSLISYLATPAAQVGVIIGLVQIIRNLGVKTKLLPIASLLVGMICGTFVYGFISGYGIIKGMLIGVALGLASSGLFEYGKTYLENLTKK